MLSSKDFIILADRDFKVSQSLERDFPDEYAVSAAAYHIQQAIEKELKALILLNGQNPEFTHNIMKLCKTCESLKVELPEELELISEALTMWETTSRYDPFVMVSEKKYELAKGVFKDLRNMLDFAVNEEIEEVEAPELDIKFE